MTSATAGLAQKPEDSRQPSFSHFSSYNCRMPQSARPMILWGLRGRPAIMRKASAQVG